jgi:hypothetical protein
MANLSNRLGNLTFVVGQLLCEGEFSHPLDLQGLSLGLDNLLAQSCDENHQIMMKQKDKKKGDGH